MTATWKLPNNMILTMENNDCLNTVHLFYRTIEGKTLGVLVESDAL